MHYTSVLKKPEKLDCFVSPHYNLSVGRGLRIDQAHPSRSLSLVWRFVRRKSLLVKIILILLLWLLVIILEGLTLLFGAFVPNHAKALNALGLSLLVLFPLCGIIGTILLLP